MRVLAVNDLSCVGKCSLTVALPVLSACGVTCDVLPTAVLSTHTGGFEDYTFRDLSSDFPAILTQWKKLGLTFDVIYSGYLANESQIDAVLFLKQNFLKAGGKLVVDPVMGDGGKLYAGFSPSFVEKMRGLCQRADYILPNRTEACFLTETPYPSDGETLLNKLSSLTPCPIVTGVEEENSIAVYHAEKGVPRRYATPTTQGFFCGAGDVFASSFVGALVYGKPLGESVALSAQFTAAAIERSAKEVSDKRYGLNFEKELFSFVKKLRGE
ncbi:MAG: pyridoxamine kinase [Clostridia bacterium]|nr:pyridoxamine kinase [Clostridia bacterium]